MPQASLREEKLLSSLLSNRLLQFLLVSLILSSVVLFYNFAGSKESFLSETKIMKEKEQQNIIKSKSFDDADIDHAAKHTDEFLNDFHILFMFTNVDKNPGLQKKLSTVLESMFEFAKFNPDQILHLHFVCDEKSKDVAGEEASPHSANPHVHLETHFHDVEELATEIYPIVKTMQEHFGNHAYFKDAIFFLSVAMHRIMPENIHRVVQLDLDLKINTNIRDLWEEFDYFKHSNLFGLARENQPVYRHTFWKFRKENPGTKVGAPPPDGITGFNSGVVLLDLDKIRESEVYNKILDDNTVEKLVEKYQFKGHLGDQDFFTLLSIDYPELFYVLECVWNKQLCEWWRSRGYDQVFDKYFICNGYIKIWHGNCNTPFPAEENYDD